MFLWTVALLQFVALLSEALRITPAPRNKNWWSPKAAGTARNVFTPEFKSTTVTESSAVDFIHKLRKADYQLNENNKGMKSLLDSKLEVTTICVTLGITVLVGAVVTGLIVKSRGKKNSAARTVSLGAEAHSENGGSSRKSGSKKKKKKKKRKDDTQSDDTQSDDTQSDGLSYADQPDPHMNQYPDAQPQFYGYPNGPPPPLPLPPPMSGAYQQYPIGFTRSAQRGPNFCADLSHLGHSFVTCLGFNTGHDTTPNKKTEADDTTPNKKTQADDTTPNKKTQADDTTPNKKTQADDTTPNKKTQADTPSYSPNEGPNSRTKANQSKGSRKQGKGRKKNKHRKNKGGDDVSESASESTSIATTATLKEPPPPEKRRKSSFMETLLYPLTAIKMSFQTNETTQDEET